MRKTVISPAKVNLYLKVLSKRPDGYHNILSVVDIISLCDTVHIQDTENDEIIVCDDQGILPRGEGNTVFRAARLLKEAAAVRRGVRIDIEKRIPIGSGLGGPSTNAATVLKELSTLWGLGLNKEDQCRIGSMVGADVPLFIHGKSCVMEGIGDIVNPVELPFMWYLIVYPNIAISTRLVYEGLKIVLTKKENDIKLMSNFKKIGDITSILENDLEYTGITMCPQIGAIKNRLKEAGALGSLMSGSGSSVFGIFENREDARKASSAVENMGRVIVASSYRGGVGADGDNGC